MGLDTRPLALDDDHTCSIMSHFVYVLYLIHTVFLLSTIEYIFAVKPVDSILSHAFPCMYSL